MKLQPEYNITSKTNKEKSEKTSEGVKRYEVLKRRKKRKHFQCSKTR